MRTKIALLTGLVVVFMLLVSCAPQAPAAPAMPAPEKPGVSPAPSAAPAVAPWQKEWDKVVEAAKREGKVVIYSTGGTGTRAAISKGFKQKYGLDAEVLTAPGGATAEKILTERRAGLYVADIYIGGATTVVTQLKPVGVFDSLEPALILPEVANPKLWWGGQLNWVDKDHQIFLFEAYTSGDLGINTELVKPGEIKVLNDLLNPKWKGKIIINDPTIAGTGVKFVGVVVTKRSWDFWREMASKQEPIVLRDARLQVDWLARGKYAIVIIPKSEPMTEFINAGAPITGLATEIQYVTGDVMGMPNKAPHPNAAKVFINWFLGPEGQRAYSESQGTVSAREDVAVATVPAYKQRKTGVEYFNSITEDFLLAQADHMKTAKEVFGPLMK